MTYRLTIPLLFAEDRYTRDLPLGDGRFTPKGYTTRMNREQLDELLSDAEHYANGGIDPAYISKSLINSARKTVERIRELL